MSLFSWGVDGYGRKTICRRDSNIGLLCPIKPAYFYDCMDLLEEQENKRIAKLFNDTQRELDKEFVRRSNQMKPKTGFLNRTYDI